MWYFTSEKFGGKLKRHCWHCLQGVIGPVISLWCWLCPLLAGGESPQNNLSYYRQSNTKAIIMWNIEVGALRHFLSDFRQDCHPSWWKFRWIAWIGENWGDKIVTKFGDTLGDDFVTYCFTQYGDFLGELPEMVRVKVTKMSPNLVTILVTILSLFVSPIMVIFGGICQNWW